ncbi:amidase [Chelativorans salis]|uniref:Amidase n=1 Tax=Chelativorans salis TaxID=2978478 RepID=A0ABT2LST4_9HYPH|nr:amidase [Chelativorans sp. EGI FJ00035]MCT7377544.1 amidase [Chelativorans sp. EGI FJ00035]
MTATRDPLNAFLDYPETPVPSAPDGPLMGLTLAVKDIYDVAGYPTGGGNPQKEAESGNAEATAPAIHALLDAGARFAGKTQTDELTYSMIGMNAHFPPPVNPRARERVTGGSSSGSVAAVAGGLADIAVGSDTNGSIRAPASFCGLIGLRTTHGRISMEGAMPLAPSFDTFGWFARDAAAYTAVGEVLLGEDTHGRTLRRPVRIAELEALLFGEAERTAYGAMLGRVLDHFEREPGFLALPGAPDELFERFKEIQAYEAWEVHAPFLRKKDRDLGPGVKERFAYARSISTATVETARQRQCDFQADFAALMDPDMVVVMPTQPSAPPLKIATQPELETYRAKALTLTSIAGLLGWPQITIPLDEVHGAPFGISLLGPAGSDRQLIRLATSILS